MIVFYCRRNLTNVEAALRLFKVSNRCIKARKITSLCFLKQNRKIEFFSPSVIIKTFMFSTRIVASYFPSVDCALALAESAPSS